MAVAPDILCLVAGIGAGQAAQRHQPVHECELRVRFTGPNKLVDLIEAGEVVPRGCRVELVKGERVRDGRHRH